MPKKSGTKAKRTRTNRPSRPAASIPVQSATPPIQSPQTDDNMFTPRETVTPPSAPRQARSPLRSTPRLRPSGLTMIKDYGYVASDLKRIGLLASGAVVVLLGLTFIIH